MHTVEYLPELKKKEEEYNKKIDEAYSNYEPDEVLNRLKHERFLVRDEIRLLEEGYGKDV
jgi:hypothetical protein